MPARGAGVYNEYRLLSFAIGNEMLLNQFVCTKTATLTDLILKLHCFLYSINEFWFEEK